MNKTVNLGLVGAFALLALSSSATALSSPATANTGLPRCDANLHVNPNDIYVEIRVPPYVSYDPGVDATIRCYMTYLEQFVASDSAAASTGLPECDVTAHVDPNDIFVYISPKVIDFATGVTAVVRCYVDYLQQFASSDSAAAKTALPECDIKGHVNPNDIYVLISTQQIDWDTGVAATVYCYMTYLQQFASSDSAAAKTGLPECDLSAHVNPNDVYVFISTQQINWDTGVAATLQCYMTYLEQFVSTPAAL